MNKYEPNKVQHSDAIKLPCPRCGYSGALSVGQMNFRGELRWFESINCEQCGLRSEADGKGFPPLGIRNMLIERDGEWSVLMKHIKSASNSVKVLQGALSVDMRTAMSLLRTETRIVFRGTKSESLWLIGLLEAAGEVPAISIVE